MTKYAKLILASIHQSNRHMTAEQLFLELKNTEPKIVQATVYNNLNTLCKKGLIRKISIDGSPDRYDKVQRHDHLICKKCGALSDMIFKDLTADLKKHIGEKMISYDLKVYHLCPNCREKQ